MFSSVFLTNVFLCSIAVILLIPLVRNPKLLRYKNGLPLLIFSTLMLAKLLLPYEFAFTTTLPSTYVLPLIRSLGTYHTIAGITVQNLMHIIWVSVSCFILGRVTMGHRKYDKTLSVVPVTKDQKVLDLFNTLCDQKKVKTRPKLIMLDHTSPFIFGFRKVTLVLPKHLSEDMYRFILLHELEHIKHRHVFIKACIELITILYWWNPIVWLARKEILGALEVHSDSNVMKSLDKNTQMAYLNSIITLTRKFSSNRATSLALTFTLNDHFVVYRIKTALSLIEDSGTKKQLIKTVIALLVSLMIFMGSFFYTFEQYIVLPEIEESTFLINSKTDYFVANEDQTFDLYIKGELMGTLDTIPKEFSDLPVK